MVPMTHGVRHNNNKKIRLATRKSKEPEKTKINLISCSQIKTNQIESPVLTVQITVFNERQTMRETRIKRINCWIFHHELGFECIELCEMCCTMNILKFIFIR